MRRVTHGLWREPSRDKGRLRPPWTSLTTSIIDNATEAEITGNSASVTAGNVQLHAQDDSKIFTVAGQLAGSGNTAVGAGVAVAVITNTTRSRIVDAEVDADQTVAVQAVSKSIVASIGVSGQGSSTAAVVPLTPPTQLPTRPSRKFPRPAEARSRRERSAFKLGTRRSFTRWPGSSPALVTQRSVERLRWASSTMRPGRVSPT